MVPVYAADRVKIARKSVQDISCGDGDKWVTRADGFGDARDHR